jgi:hypothetical protein
MFVSAGRASEYDLGVGISSEEARSIQFSGSDHAYDGSEVEEFRRRVIDTLQAHEAALRGMSEPDEEDLASAQRVRQQAVSLSERMLRDVMGASEDGTGGLMAFQEAAMLRAVAEEEMAHAEEESRRLTAIAFAERDAIRARYAQERKDLRAELQRELQASRDAADAEAQQSASGDARRLERRLAVLHTALGDAESRFRRLAATAANDLGTLEAMVDREPEEPIAPPAEIHVAAVDLTEGAMDRITRKPEHVADPGMVSKDPDVGFYERRLAGLRDRLEKSGHPPE